MTFVFKEKEYGLEAACSIRVLDCPDAAGMTGYLVKPLNVEAMLEELAKLE